MCTSCSAEVAGIVLNACSMAESVLPGPGAGDPEPAATATTTTTTCPVCLAPFSGQTVATLENCQHAFCLECILEWSKTANTCPVDRTAFGVVYQRLCLGGGIEREIWVQRRSPAGDEADGRGRETVQCEVCGRSDRSHQLLICTHCDSGYHMNCLTAPVEITQGAVWSCPDCAPLSPPLSEDEQVSDDELTELLVEAEEVWGTPSRLRPSTLNQPGHFTGVRRSQRIQNASGGNGNPALQPCLHVPKYLMRATQSAEPVDGETSAHPKNGQKEEVMSNGAQPS